MKALPTGTVTFVFTDIEGSTRLLQRLRAGYAGVLREHDRVMRAAFEEHGGREVEARGDGFFVAFARARDALAAAVMAQRELARRPWPDGGDVRIRIGVHTGEADVEGDNYVGLDVHRAARICSAGHGGQVLVSAATRELVGDDLPVDVVVEDLGEHWLKDLDRPERLFQAKAADLRTQFPPPRSRSSAGARVPGGLPSLPNATIGRDEDVRAVAVRLRPRNDRLITLTGPGGVGKTRLAIEAARAAATDFADGARFVSLASLRAADKVEMTIALALKLIVSDDEEPREALARWLAPRELVLVIDNFEHLLSAAPVVNQLLAGADGLTVLTTSREPLHVQGERVVRVSGLAVEDAARLFAERARDRDPNFGADDSEQRRIATICRQLDGLPLAIELTAPWATLLSPSQLASRLEQPLALLDRGPRDAPRRQRTLRAAIDWSYELLDHDTRLAFAALSVFAGGCGLEAAQRVTGAGLHTLAALETKSLIVRDGERLVLLETLREFAAERLTSHADADEIRLRHARYYLALAEDGEKGIQGSEWGVWRRRLDAEIDNFRAAFAWLLTHDQAGDALALATALQPARWHDREIYEWLHSALPRAKAVAPTRAIARALVASSRFFRLDRTCAERDALAALELYQGLADEAGIADSLGSLSHLLVVDGRYREAAARAEQALAAARSSGDEQAICAALLLRVAAGEGFDEVRSLASQALAHFRRAGSTGLILPLLNNAAYVAIEGGRYGDALPLLDEALAAALVGEAVESIAAIQGNRAVAFLFLGDDQRATDALVQQLRLWREFSSNDPIDEALLCAAVLAARRGKRHEAGRLAGASEALVDRTVRTAGEERVFQRMQDQLLRPCRDADPEGWGAALRAGSALSEHEGIDNALGVLNEDRRKSTATTTKHGPTPIAH